MTSVIDPDLKLDLRGSEALAEAIRTRRGSDVTINLARVEQFGAHAAQTLLVAHRPWEADRHAFVLAAPSTVVIEAIAAMGLADEPPFAGDA